VLIVKCFIFSCILRTEGVQEVYWTMWKSSWSW